MKNKTYRLSVNFSNIKSHYSKNGVAFEAKKPITVIAGPNGEGKSNLLEAILLGMGKYILKSPKLKKNSSFTKKVEIKNRPKIYTTFQEMVFDDLIKKGLYLKKTEITYPDRFLPDQVISYNKKAADIQTIVTRDSDVSTRVLGNSKVQCTKYDFKTTILKNELDHLDLFFLNNDPSLYDLFVKYVAQTYSEEIESISGQKGKIDYYTSILNYFPEEARIIQDVHNGRFEEKYHKNKFITNALPTGAKKECLLYAIGILSRMHRDKKDWMSVILIDELEAGLHITRQKKMVDALINSCKKDEYIKNNIRIILTTHSPIVYAELNKHPSLVDTSFILREPNKASIIYNPDDVIKGNGSVEKKILSELGLNVYDIPNQILFVEGPTDKLFFDQIFDNTYIQPFYTCKISKILKDFITSFPIARSKDYSVIVDKNGKKSIQSDIDEISDKEVKFNIKALNYNSLEEFMYGIDISSGGKPSTIWNKIESKEKEWEEYLPDELSIELNATKARKWLEKKGRDGIRTYFGNNIKKNKALRSLYVQAGKKYKEMLTEGNVKHISHFAKSFHLKLK